jgi:signal transduction histidine kinase
MSMMFDEYGKDQKNRFQSTEEKFTEIEIFLSGVLNSLNEHVAVIERDGTILAVNAAWRRFAEENDAESPDAVSKGANYFDICEEATGEEKNSACETLKGIRAVISGKQDSFSIEYPCNSPHEERWFIMNVVPLKRPQGGAVITHTNITRRVLAERKTLASEQHLRNSREEYRELARKLITAQEDARRRLARELHDSFSQRLALVSMLAARMEIDCRGSKGEEGLKRIQEEMSQLSGDVHDISRQLHPYIIEDLGLPDAIDSFCRSFSKNEGIAVNFECSGLDGEIDLETSLNLYRIIQESMRNTAKHARAGSISVRLREDEDALRLSVVDDGVGFDPDAVREKKRLGLVSIRERAALIGGDIEIVSSPGQGTSISVYAPISPHD